jgi:hypothetical protein
VAVYTYDEVVMARMYPPQLDPTDEHIPTSEHKVYTALRDQLDETFVVFHSAAWLGRGQRGELSDGEADFVIAHPQLGILILEVKGGRIQYDGTEVAQRQWATLDRYDTRHWLKRSPFEQALRSKYALKQKLEELPTWDGRKFTLGHAVIFPDVSADLPILPAGIDSSILIDGRAMAALSSRITQAYHHWRGSHPLQALGNTGIQLIISLLAPTFTLKSPLAARIGNDQAHVLTLTKQQFRILTTLQRKRQALITGCAGSGKTALAVEKSQRLAREGMKVLLLCFNSRLADQLKIQLQSIAGITVGTFHQICIAFAQDAQINIHRPPGMEDDEYFNHFLPEQLLLASEHPSNRHFDALIVDEAQDFQSHWWDILSEWLVPQPIIYIFYDDNQRLFTQAPTFPVNDDALFLDVNCRNTQTIHGIAQHFYSGQDADVITAQGPVGEAIEVHLYDNPIHERDILAKVLVQLSSEQGVLPQQIAILTRYRPQQLDLSEKTIGGFVLREQTRGAQQILCCTIQSFKGLERAVVIVAGLGDISDQAELTQLESLLYVACSRATSHLIVLLPRNTARRLRRVFQP